MDVDAVGRGPAPTEPEVGEVEVVAGLAECEQVPTLAPDEAHGPVGAISLDQRVMATLADYGAANEDSFGGLWLDARYGGAPVAAFVGDLAAHRSSILADLAADGDTSAGGSAGAAVGASVPFGLAQALYSERDLERAVDEIAELAEANDIGAYRSGAVDAARNRVAVALLDPTEAELDRLLELLEPQLICVDVAISAPRPEGPLDVLPSESGGQELLSCGEFPFPASAIEKPVPIQAIDHPAADQVAEFTGTVSEGAKATASPGDWIVLAIGADQAFFGKYDGNGIEATASAESSGGGWEIIGWAFGCELRVGLPLGLGEVEVFLDPANRPGPADRSVTVLVTELACADGQEMGDRLLGPQVRETDEAVLLAFAAVPPIEPGVECPGNPMTPVVVELDGPLGGRPLLDGLRIPARPLIAP